MKALKFMETICVTSFCIYNFTLVLHVCPNYVAVKAAGFVRSQDHARLQPYIAWIASIATSLQVDAFPVAQCTVLSPNPSKTCVAFLSEKKNCSVLQFLYEANIAVSIIFQWVVLAPAVAAQVRRTGRSTVFHTSLPLNHNRQWNLVRPQLLAQKARDMGAMSLEKLSVCLSVCLTPVFLEQGHKGKLSSNLSLDSYGDASACWN